MRLEHRARQTTDLPAEPDLVIQRLVDPDTLFAVVAPLVHHESTASRWVMADVQLGPLALRPAVEITIRRIGDVVVVDGTPATGHTPAWLQIDARVTGSASGFSRLEATWDVAFDAPGPQLLARTLHGVFVAAARRVSEDVGRRLRSQLLVD